MILETGKVYRVKHTSGMIEWKFQNMAEYGAIGSGRDRKEILRKEPQDWETDRLKVYSED